MQENKYFQYSDRVIIAPLIAVLAIWVVYYIEIKFGVNFNTYGISPRQVKGLRGILFAPFIHGSLSHLFNNTIPLALLTAGLFYFYRHVAMRVLILGFLLTGVLTWLIGRPSFHIGVSGIIYLLASFIFFKGVFAKHFRMIALSLTVAFVYGGMLWYMFPVEEGISWEGHLSGFLSGLVLAYAVKTPLPERKKYAWEVESYNETDDLFLQHFDADGNFIAHKPYLEEE